MIGSYSRLVLSVVAVTACFYTKIMLGMGSEVGTSAKQCPRGFILVAENPTIGLGSSASTGVEGFCVAKYEMKLSPETQLAVSQPQKKPWGYLTRDQAVDACLDAGFRLMSNSEWMTIARDIENEPSNWSGAAVGMGAVARGHSDSSPYSTLSAGENDIDPYFGTNNTASDGWDQKRTHNLSNGSVIWDFSGNSSEWILEDKTTLGIDLVDPNSYNRIMSQSETNQLILGPENILFGEKENMAVSTLFGTRKNIRIHRGGAYQSSASIYEINLNAFAHKNGSRIGFRCTTTPSIALEHENKLDDVDDDNDVAEGGAVEGDSMLTDVIVDGVEDEAEMDLKAGQPLVCPKGFIYVPGNDTVGLGGSNYTGVDDFCVAQYEMRQGVNNEPVPRRIYRPWSHVTAISTSKYHPWVHINKREAIEACENSGFRLINNAEWMTIARNIESSAQNWSGLAVGVGVLPTGVGSTDHAESAIELRTFHYLTTGEKIWSLGAGVHEWLQDSKSHLNFARGNDITRSEMFVQMDELVELNRLIVGPLNPSFNQEQGVGGMLLEYGYGTTSDMARGGSDRASFNRPAGIFTLFNSRDILEHRGKIGFRCVTGRGGQLNEADKLTETKECPPDFFKTAFAGIDDFRCVHSSHAGNNTYDPDIFNY